MKQLLILPTLLLAILLCTTATAQTTQHRTRPQTTATTRTHHRPAKHPVAKHPVARPRPAAAPKVYVCNGGSAYAYHSSEGCSGLNRCTHTVDAVTVTEAQGMGRRPCKKCY